MANIVKKSPITAATMFKSVADVSRVGIGISTGHLAQSQITMSHFASFYRLYITYYSCPTGVALYAHEIELPTGTRILDGLFVRSRGWIQIDLAVEHHLDGVIVKGVIGESIGGYLAIIQVEASNDKMTWNGPEQSQVST